MNNQEWFNQSLLSTPTTNFVEVEGAKIHYLTWGDNKKPGLFFIHGFSANAHWWDFISPAFIDDYCVVAIDLSGSGDSDHRDAYSQEMYAKEIKSVCDAMGWQSADFIAHSMGGSISLNATSIYPEIFKSLYLLDSIVILPPDKVRNFSSNRSMIRADFVYEDEASAVESFRLIPPQPCRNEFLLDHIAINSYKQTEEGWLLKSDGKMMKTYQSKDLTETLMAIQCPIYIVYGLMSQIFTQEILDYTVYVGNIPPERVIGVPGTMHHLFVDDPLSVIEELKKLLGDN
ncbi:MAG TPA: alpha/beta hydrolase [SAR86 cluster bacterium]|nr:alpha/beta hydrolase [SAR86 cluster bacterium]